MASPRLVPDVVAQQAFDEVTIEDEDLKTALEARQAAKQEASEARAAYKFAGDRANGEIAKLELPVGGAVRCGRFRITRRAVEARSVSFETGASDRVTIALVD
jgi:hypothetical protein